MRTEKQQIHQVRSSSMTGSNATTLSCPGLTSETSWTPFPSSPEHEVMWVPSPQSTPQAVHVSSPLPVVQWPTYPTPTPEGLNLIDFQKSDGSCHDMVKNSRLDKDSDAINFQKLRPALVFPSQPFCYFTSTATWQNVVPLPERESDSDRPADWAAMSERSLNSFYAV
eukprot:symbB.v1.2.019837.t1/scaffold1644.1/size164340/7